jgi:hypothetical protein
MGASIRGVCPDGQGSGRTVSAGAADLFSIGSEWFDILLFSFNCCKTGPAGYPACGHACSFTPLCTNSPLVTAEKIVLTRMRNGTEEGPHRDKR